MTKPHLPLRTWTGSLHGDFDIRVSSFLRHSSLELRHSASAGESESLPVCTQSCEFNFRLPCLTPRDTAGAAAGEYCATSGGWGKARCKRDCSSFAQPERRREEPRVIPSPPKSTADRSGSACRTSPTP